MIGNRPTGSAGGTSAASEKLASEATVGPFWQVLCTAALSARALTVRPQGAMLERPDAALRSLALLPAEPFIEVGAAEHFVQDAVRARA